MYKSEAGNGFPHSEPYPLKIGIPPAARVYFLFCDSIQVLELNPRTHKHLHHGFKHRMKTLPGFSKGSNSFTDFSRYSSITDSIYHQIWLVVHDLHPHESLVQVFQTARLPEAYRRGTPGKRFRSRLPEYRLSAGQCARRKYDTANRYDRYPARG